MKKSTEQMPKEKQNVLFWDANHKCLVTMWQLKKVKGRFYRLYGDKESSKQWYAEARKCRAEADHAFKELRKARAALAEYESKKSAS